VTWHKQNLHSPIVGWERIVRNQSFVDHTLVLHDAVDFNSVFKVVRDSNDLWVITLNVHLLHFSLAESSNITAYEIFKQNRILFEVAGCHEPSVHDYVKSIIQVAKHTKQMVADVSWVRQVISWAPSFYLYGRPLLVFSRQLTQLLEGAEERVVEVFNYDLIITSVLYQVVFAINDGFDQLEVVGSDCCVFTVCVQSVVLEELEEVGTIEAVAVSSESSDVSVASAAFGLGCDKSSEAILKLRADVFVHNYVGVKHL
jgi:hypothetical protein